MRPKELTDGPKSRALKALFGEDIRVMDLPPPDMRQHEVPR
jgi:hypothetical protein